MSNVIHMGMQDDNANDVIRMKMQDIVIKNGKIWYPTVDENGNISWVLDSTIEPPTSQNIKGPAGANGQDGKDGRDGVDGKDGVDGRDGIDGKDGADGLGIKSVDINAQEHLIVTYDDDTTHDAGELPSGAEIFVAEYGVTTFQQCKEAFGRNALVFCKTSANNADPSDGTKKRMAFLAYVERFSSGSVKSFEFQYYRSRSAHNSSDTQVDQVFIYKLEHAGESSPGVWSWTPRNVASKLKNGVGTTAIFTSDYVQINVDNPVTANPELVGTEGNLTSIQIGDTKYKIPSVEIDDTSAASDKVYSSEKVEEGLSDLRMTFVETDGLLIANAVELTELTTENRYVNVSDGKTKTNNNDARLVTLQVEEGEVYQLYSGFQYSVCMYSILDVNGNAIEWFPKTSQNAYTYAAKTVRIPKGGAMLYVGSYLTNGHVPPVIYKNTLSTAQFEVDHSSNILYGKKWCVCGDSFTAGEFSGYTDKDGHKGTSSDAYDPISKEAKTYHYLIKKRNGMRIQSLADTGATFTNISGFTKPFSNSSSTKNYTQIATDCDYITLMYGLNESDLTDEQIGTNSDNTNETLWGAYNVVLTSIFTANPKAKIGIIISDAWLSQKYHDALVAISEYWGIPYLDLRNGLNMPMMINGRLDSHSATAQALHDAIYAINYPSNMHPTPLGHEVRSTVIENFLRTL